MASRGPPPLSGDINYGWKLEAGTTITFLLAAIVTGLRCVARIKYSKWGWDDSVMLFALILGLIATILDFVACNWGLGRHSFYLTVEEGVNLQYYALLSQVFCVNAITFAKISIIIAYLRILKGSRNVVQQTLLWVVGILNFVINTGVVVTLYTACNPTSKSWDPRIPGTCWSAKTKSGPILLQGIFSILSDFFLALFPIVMLSKLNVSRKTKGVILFLMGLGMLTGVFAIIRTAEFGISLNAPPAAGPPDGSFSSIDSLLWAGMERNIAIMVGSAPGLRSFAPPLRKLYSNTFGSSSSKKYSSAPVNSYQLSDGRKFNKLADSEAASRNGTRKPGSSVTVTTSEEQIFPANVV